MDLILCRNALIYFDEENVSRIAARLFSCLTEGGALLTAGADPLLGDFAPFEIEVTRVGLLYRRPARKRGARPAVPAPGPPPPAAPIQAAAPEASVEPPAAPPLTDLGREAFFRVVGAANARGALQGERIAQAALRRHPLDAHLHYLRATLLIALDRDEEAEEEVLRALYLDRSLVIAHFLLGTILRKRGARAEALRAFRNVRDLCAARPADEEVAAGAGERTGALRAAASVEMEQLEGSIA
jgi:chemotaxis protein methyltransferase CheR